MEQSSMCSCCAIYCTLYGACHAFCATGHATAAASGLVRLITQVPLYAFLPSMVPPPRVAGSTLKFSARYEPNFLDLSVFQAMSLSLTASASATGAVCTSATVDTCTRAAVHCKFVLYVEHIVRCTSQLVHSNTLHAPSEKRHRTAKVSLKYDHATRPQGLTSAEVSPST